MALLKTEVVMAEMKLDSTWARDVFMCINKGNTLTPRGKLKSQSKLGRERRAMETAAGPAPESKPTFLQRPLVIESSQKFKLTERK